MRKKRKRGTLTSFNAVVDGLVIRFSVFPELLSKQGSFPMIGIFLHLECLLVHAGERAGAETFLDEWIVEAPRVACERSGKGGKIRGKKKAMDKCG